MSLQQSGPGMPTGTAYDQASASSASIVCLSSATPPFVHDNTSETGSVSEEHNDAVKNETGPHEHDAVVEKEDVSDEHKEVLQGQDIQAQTPVCQLNQAEAGHSDSHVSGLSLYQATVVDASEANSPVSSILDADLPHVDVANLASEQQQEQAQDARNAGPNAYTLPSPPWAHHYHNHPHRMGTLHSRDTMPNPMLHRGPGEKAPAGMDGRGDTFAGSFRPRGGSIDSDGDAHYLDPALAFGTEEYTQPLADYYWLGKDGVYRKKKTPRWNMPPPPDNNSPTPSKRKIKNIDLTKFAIVDQNGTPVSWNIDAMNDQEYEVFLREQYQYFTDCRGAAEFECSLPGLTDADRAHANVKLERINHSLLDVEARLVNIEFGKPEPQPESEDDDDDDGMLRGNPPPSADATSTGLQVLETHHTAAPAAQPPATSSHLPGNGQFPMPAFPQNLVFRQHPGRVDVAERASRRRLALELDVRDSLALPSWVNIPQQSQPQLGLSAYDARVGNAAYMPPQWQTTGGAGPEGFGYAFSGQQNGYMGHHNGQNGGPGQRIQQPRPAYLPPQATEDQYGQQMPYGLNGVPGQHIQQPQHAHLPQVVTQDQYGQQMPHGQTGQPAPYWIPIPRALPASFGQSTPTTMHAPYGPPVQYGPPAQNGQPVQYGPGPQYGAPNSLSQHGQYGPGPTTQYDHYNAGGPGLPLHTAQPMYPGFQQQQQGPAHVNGYTPQYLQPYHQQQPMMQQPFQGQQIQPDAAYGDFPPAPANGYGAVPFRSSIFPPTQYGEPNGYTSVHSDVYQSFGYQNMDGMGQSNFATNGDRFPRHEFDVSRESLHLQSQGNVTGPAYGHHVAAGPVMSDEAGEEILAELAGDTPLTYPGSGTSTPAQHGAAQDEIHSAGGDGTLHGTHSSLTANDANSSPIANGANSSPTVNGANSSPYTNGVSQHDSASEGSNEKENEPPSGEEADDDIFTMPFIVPSTFAEIWSVPVMTPPNRPAVPVLHAQPPPVNPTTMASDETDNEADDEADDEQEDDQDDAFV